MRNRRVKRVVRKRKRSNIVKYAQQMRKNLTKAEAKLWKYLQKYMVRWEVTFIPQGILLNRYIGDFVCYELGLVVEVDGSIHKLPHVKINDLDRTKTLIEHGFTVVRFTNTVVFRYPDNVCNNIRLHIIDLKNRN